MSYLGPKVSIPALANDGALFGIGMKQTGIDLSKTATPDAAKTVLGLQEPANDGNFYARQSNSWVVIPKYQKLNVGGVRTLDVTVPTNAKKVRINGSVIPATTNTQSVLLQLSVVSSVFRSTAGDYNISGYQHFTKTNPTTVSAIDNSTSFTGMFITQNQDTNALPIMFEGTLNVARPTTSQAFAGAFKASSYQSGVGVSHLFGEHFLQLAVSGATLNVLALRFINSHATDLWSTGSYIDLEWM